MEVRQDIYAQPDPTKTSLPHQQRVVSECLELTERVAKLRAFIDSSLTFKTLDAAEQGRLTRQNNAMVEYLHCLEERIAAWQ